MPALARNFIIPILLLSCVLLYIFHRLIALFATQPSLGFAMIDF